MVYKSFEVIPETVYFVLDLDFLFWALDKPYTSWSLLNEVVSEVSIRQQLQYNHDLQ